MIQNTSKEMSTNMLFAIYMNQERLLKFDVNLKSSSDGCLLIRKYSSFLKVIFAYLNIDNTSGFVTVIPYSTSNAFSFQYIFSISEKYKIFLQKAGSLWHIPKS